jgi:hypothetical protein
MPFGFPPETMFTFTGIPTQREVHLFANPWIRIVKKIVENLT